MKFKVGDKVKVNIDPRSINIQAIGQIYEETPYSYHVKILKLINANTSFNWLIGGRYGYSKPDGKWSNRSVGTDMFRFSTAKEIRKNYGNDV